VLVVSWRIVSEPGEASGHVFISYVRGDAHHVDRLQHALEAAGILVWRDTADLWPGQDWQGAGRWWHW
jgi:TIR domain